MCFSKANSSISLEQGQDVGNMSHSVDILGTGQGEDRNQASFLERTEGKLAPEKNRKGDALNAEEFCFQASPS